MCYKYKSGKNQDGVGSWFLVWKEKWRERENSKMPSFWPGHRVLGCEIKEAEEYIWEVAE